MWVLRLSQTIFHACPCGGRGRRRRRRGEQILEERHEIRFGAGISDRAMPDVLELPPFDVSRLHRQVLGGTF
jgi:hypothetical protein